ncbi:MAG: hypothetical protein ACD_62C00483G0001 [uncultured bacterium]|nr:MAG: hypothetical protein ACD_62C00483G0001 [uncultured bacterium]
MNIIGIQERGKFVLILFQRTHGGGQSGQGLQVFNSGYLLCIQVKHPSVILTQGFDALIFYGIKLLIVSFHTFWIIGVYLSLQFKQAHEPLSHGSKGLANVIVIPHVQRLNHTADVAQLTTPGEFARNDLLKTVSLRPKVQPHLLFELGPLFWVFLIGTQKRLNGLFIRPRIEQTVTHEISKTGITFVFCTHGTQVTGLKKTVNVTIHNG